LKALVDGSILRPRRRLIATGMPYVMPSATTEAETMALNALDEPTFHYQHSNQTLPRVQLDLQLTKKYAADHNDYSSRQSD